MKCNFHTHTNYCDGKDSPEELVKAALEKGFFALGFSSHSFTEMDKSFAMSASEAEKYRAEIADLKEKYKGEIELYCGIEQDYFSDEPTDAYDYVIGSVHYVLKNGEYVCVDNTAEIVKEAVNNIQKHSNAKNASIRVCMHPGFYLLSIADNGTKISTTDSRGIGLSNMEERVRALNGVIRFDTENGFKITIIIRR